VSAPTWKSLPESPATLWREIAKLERDNVPKPVLVPEDPVEFCRALFKFEPTEYQAKLLRDQSKRIAVRWSRQAGKTTTIALRALWFTLTHPKTLTLVVGPSLRQSMILGDRIQDYRLRLFLCGGILVRYHTCIVSKGVGWNDKVVLETILNFYFSFCFRLFAAEACRHFVLGYL